MGVLYRAPFYLSQVLKDRTISQVRVKGMYIRPSYWMSMNLISNHNLYPEIVARLENKSRQVRWNDIMRAKLRPSETLLDRLIPRSSRQVWPSEGLHESLTTNQEDYTYPAKSDTNLWLRIKRITRIGHRLKAGQFSSMSLREKLRISCLAPWLTF